MTLHWSASYIGLPWLDNGLTRDGVACWGLARLVYAERLGLDVPDYAAEVPEIGARRAVAGVYRDGATNGPWAKVDPADAREFDILVFSVGGLDAHVGVFVQPDRMLHIVKGEQSSTVDYTAGRWAPRLSGVYRHRAMMDALAA